MRVNKAVYFSIGEKEFIQRLQDMFGITYLEAVEQAINYKKEQVIYYESIGRDDIAKQLKEELGGEM